VFLFLVVLFFRTSESYKILVYNPKFAHSHTNFVARMADILVEAGHEVTTLMPEIDPALKDCTRKSNIIRVNQSAQTAILLHDFR
ncbi:hypothetical protein PMAYCL1PPCAC_16177, partial [Pristionchus mayeri]